MKNVVPDTNVLVSGLLNPFGPPGRILDLVLSGDLTLAYDDRILAEYRAVLAREKFDFDPAPIAELIGYIEAQGQAVTAPVLDITLPDANDAPFLEVVVAARSDALITGNLRHYPPASRRGVAVLSPSEFLEKWKEAIGRARK